MPANEALHDIQPLERIAAVRPYIVGVILTCPLLKVVQCILVQHRANRSDLPCERKCRNRSRSLLGLATSTNSGYDVALVRLAGDGGLQGSRELTSPRSVRDSRPALRPFFGSRHCNCGRGFLRILQQHETGLPLRRILLRRFFWRRQDNEHWHCFRR